MVGNDFIYFLSRWIVFISNTTLFFFFYFFPYLQEYHYVNKNIHDYCRFLFDDDLDFYFLEFFRFWIIKERNEEDPLHDDNDINSLLLVFLYC